MKKIFLITLLVLPAIVTYKTVSMEKDKNVENSTSQREHKEEEKRRRESGEFAMVRAKHLEGPVPDALGVLDREINEEQTETPTTGMRSDRPKINIDTFKKILERVLRENNTRDNE